MLWITCVSAASSTLALVTSDAAMSLMRGRANHLRPDVHAQPPVNDAHGGFGANEKRSAKQLQPSVSGFGARQNVREMDTLSISPFHQKRVSMSLAAQSPYALSLDGSAAPEIDKSGRIVDCIDPTVARADTPEERVRQNYARVLLNEYRYPRECMAIQAPIRIASEDKWGDIVIYDSADACRRRDQGRIALVVEAKAPTKKKGREQLTSYVFASSAEGGVWTDGREVGYFRRVQSPNGVAHRLQEWTNIPP